MYLELYPCDPNHEEKLPSQIKSELLKMWDEILLQAKGNPSEIKTEPQEAPKKNLFDYLLSPGTKYLKIAFVHDKIHRILHGYMVMSLDACILRNSLRERLKQSLIMMFHREQNLRIHLMMQLQKCNIIFTTTPQFLEGSIKTAIKIHLSRF